MTERRDPPDDPEEALKAVYGARVNNEIAAVVVALLVLVILAALSVRYWLL